MNPLTLLFSISVFEILFLTLFLVLSFFLPTGRKSVPYLLLFFHFLVVGFFLGFLWEFEEILSPLTEGYIVTFLYIVLRGFVFPPPSPIFLILPIVLFHTLILFLPRSLVLFSNPAFLLRLIHLVSLGLVAISLMEMTFYLFLYQWKRGKLTRLGVLPDSPSSLPTLHTLSVESSKSRSLALFTFLMGIVSGFYLPSRTFHAWGVGLPISVLLFSSLLLLEVLYRRSRGLRWKHMVWAWAGTLTFLFVWILFGFKLLPHG